MKRRSSTRARLERLEKALKNGALSHGQAIVEVRDWNDGERHVVVTDAAHCRFETLWASFVLRGSGAGGAGHTVYFGADSGWWEGFAEIGAAYGPFDLTLL